MINVISMYSSCIALTSYIRIIINNIEVMNKEDSRSQQGGTHLHHISLYSTRHCLVALRPDNAIDFGLGTLKIIFHPTNFFFF